METCNINEKKPFLENFNRHRKFWKDLKLKISEIEKNILSLDNDIKNKTLGPAEISNRKYLRRNEIDNKINFEKMNNEEQFFEALTEICKKIRSGESLLSKMKIIEEDECVPLTITSKQKRKKITTKEIPTSHFNLIKVLSTKKIFSKKKKINTNNCDDKILTQTNPETTNVVLKKNISPLLFDEEDEYTRRLRNLVGDDVDLSVAGVTTKLAEFLNSKFYQPDDLNICPNCSTTLENCGGSYAKCPNIRCGFLDIENGALVCEKENHPVTNTSYRSNLYVTNSVKNFCDQSKFDITSENHKQFYEFILKGLKQKDITNVSKVQPQIIEEIIQEISKDKSICDKLNSPPTFYYPYIHQICNKIRGQTMLYFNDDLMIMITNLFPIVAQIWEKTTETLYPNEERINLSATAKLCICYSILNLDKEIIKLCGGGDIKISDNEDLKNKFYQNIKEHLQNDNLDFSVFNRNYSSIKNSNISVKNRKKLLLEKPPKLINDPNIKTTSPICENIIIKTEVPAPENEKKPTIEQPFILKVEEMPKETAIDIDFDDWL